MRLPEGFDYQPGYVAPDRGDGIFRCLWRDLRWQQQDIVLFGRRVRQPRLTAWCSDPGVSYRYSGLELGPGPWHPLLAGLREELSDFLGRAFNSVLINAYRDGRDSMGWHADDEFELGAEPLIASLSLGATRRMLVRPAGGGRSTPIDLAHGSLLVMSGPSQSAWRHSIPKVRRDVGPRINLTFRTVF